MKNSYLLISAFLLLLVSCTSESDTTPSPEVNPKLRLIQKSITTGWSGESVTSVWNYDGQKLVSIISDNGSEQHFTYNDNLIVSVESSNEFGEVTTDSYEYDDQGRITTHLDISADWGRKQVYEYAPDGSISVTQYFGSDESQTQIVMQGVLLMQNGEITHTKTLNVDSGYGRICDYTYDTHNTPTRNIIGYDKISSLLSTNQKGIFHNVLTNTQTTEGQDPVLVTKTYVYDSLDFPLRIVSSDPLDGDSGITEYIY
ncbi:hypothetical protein [Flavobacterium silvaticum]|uniref:YD repeat-containing protein n=1 Tax=Flavobacterium silvaticum TaxID=1852020 RepID=A0A972FJ57_9FLAO|nr:hypothetical protein [Flavobacterium silvaticum]NMH26733.1 hypothetical protein [Flavobacterium silvaticum]